MYIGSFSMLAVSTVLTASWLSWRTELPQRHLPGSSLSIAASIGSQSAVAELLTRQPHTEEADRLLAIADAARSRTGELPRSLESAIDAGLSSGLFSSDAAAAFFANTVRLSLRTEERAEGVRLRLSADAEILETPFAYRLAVIVHGFRIGDRDWLPRSGPETRMPRAVTSVFHDFVDHNRRGPTFGSSHTHNDRDSPPMLPRSLRLPEDLPAGSHRLTLRVTLLVYSQGGMSTRQSHTHLDPQGNPIPDPNAIWQETRDLTATFVVP